MITVNSVERISQIITQQILYRYNLEDAVHGDLQFNNHTTKLTSKTTSSKFTLASIFVRPHRKGSGRRLSAWAGIA